MAENPGRQERVIGADDEPGGRRGQDVRGDEAGGGADDGGDHTAVVKGRRRRRVVDGFDVFGDLVGAGEVEGARLGGVAEGDVEGGGVGEGLDELFEGVLVGGAAVFVGEEVLGGAHADGGAAGDEEGFDVVGLGGHGGGCFSSCCCCSCSRSSWV